MDRVIPRCLRPPLAPALAPLRRLLKPRTRLRLGGSVAFAKAAGNALVLLARLPAVLERPSQGVRRRG